MANSSVSPSAASRYSPSVIPSLLYSHWCGLEFISSACVMRLLGWERQLLRFGGGEVRRGFVRGGGRRTVYVFVCPVTGEVTVAHDPPSETDRYGRAAATQSLPPAR